MWAALLLAEEERFGFSVIMRLAACAPHCALAPQKNTGRANHPQDGLLFRPSNLFHTYCQTQIPPMWAALLLAEEERFGFSVIMRLAACAPHCALAPQKNTGRANHPQDGLLFRPSNLFHTYCQTQIPPMWAVFVFGGGGEIRTLERLMTVTRFPIVRPRPN